MTGYKAGRAEAAMNQFHELLLQRGFTLLFIRTLEEQRSFTIRDKYVSSNVGTTFPQNFKVLYFGSQNR